MDFCPSCSAATSAGSAFCTSCGGRLDGSTSPVGGTGTGTEPRRWTSQRATASPGEGTTAQVVAPPTVTLPPPAEPVTGPARPTWGSPSTSRLPLKALAAGAALVVAAAVGAGAATLGSGSGDDSGGDQLTAAGSGDALAPGGTEAGVPDGGGSAGTGSAGTGSAGTGGSPAGTAAGAGSATAAPSATADPSPRLLHPVTVDASCVAPPSQDSQGSTVTYEPARVTDGVGETAWRCPGAAVGESLVLGFAEPVTVTAVGLVPGYDKVDPYDGIDRFTENRTVTAVVWRFDDGTAVRQDIPAPTRSLDRLALPSAVRTSWVALEIVDTGNDGANRDYTPISDVELLGY